MEFKDLIAFCALGLSIISLCWQFYTFRYDRKPQLRISTEIKKVPARQLTRNPTKFKYYIYVTIINPGRVKVIISGIRFRGRRRKQLVIPTLSTNQIPVVQFPMELHPGDRTVIRVFQWNVAAELSSKGSKKARALVIDSLDRKYSAKNRVKLNLFDDDELRNTSTDFEPKVF